jgi:predicted ATPase/DNA-binding CsgD family transcriptional regulator
VKLLVTSRERLNLSSETVFNVDGMRVPESETAENALDYSAVKLFVQSARRVRPGFSLNDGDLPVLVHICRLVGGMPLAILLAAAWLEVLSLKDIAAELEHGIDILETEMRDIPERQRSVRAAFDASWRRMSDAEQEVFKKLSVFRGGFTREAAQAVAGASLKVLATLVNKSMIYRDASGRYDLHELLRQYGEARLDETPAEVELAQERYCAYYADFMAQREGDLFQATHPDNQSEGLIKIETEIENARQAFYQAVERSALAEIRQFLLSLWYFYEIRGGYQEGEAVFRHTVRQLRGRFGELEEEYRKTVAQCLACQGRFALLLAHFNEGKALLLECLAIRTTSPGLEHLMGLCFLVSEYALEDYAQGKAWSSEILTVATQIDFPLSAAVAHVTLGIWAALEGDYAEAERQASEALAISRAIHDRFEECWSFWALTQIAFQQQDYAKAKSWSHASLASAKAVGFQQGILNAYFSLGDITCAQANYAEARQYYQQCRTMSQDLGNRLWIARALCGLGRAACGLDACHESWEQLTEALRLAQEAQSVPIILEVLEELAELFAKTGAITRAAELSALVLNHPPVSTVNNPGAGHRIRERAAHLSASLQAELGAEAYGAAWQRGMALELDAAVSSLLNEAHVDQPSPPTTAVRKVPSLLVEPLTERELEVLRLIAEGLSNIEIAERLFVGVSTVKKHINHIYGKLGVESRTQALLRAQALNLF